MFRNGQIVDVFLPDNIVLRAEVLDQRGDDVLVRFRDKVIKTYPAEIVFTPYNGLDYKAYYREQLNTRIREKVIANYGYHD